MTESRSICVFAGSSRGTRPEYAAAARALGLALARRGYDLVYGGSATGLMGVVANVVLEEGRQVCGVIPQFLVDKEVAHQGLSELVVVGSMHERKQEMARRCWAFVALPGGLGTIEELAEVLTWAQLGLHAKPCGLFDVAGFFAPFLSFLDHACAEGFIQRAHRGLISCGAEPVGLLEKLEAYQPVVAAKGVDEAES